ncbi:MAG: ABC transporter ATP-binding protein [Kiritimatiellaeota bacterium]|nr:ABC transporter ATP-binding protein [Kiritimatiellota bacterium]
MEDNLLNVDQLSVFFRTRTEPVRAVNGVSFSVAPGETVALVGESGCGKSVTALALTRLVAKPGYVAGGNIRFAGRDVLAMDPAQLRQMRGAEIAYIFQEPATSLNPVFRVGWQIAEALKLHRAGIAVRAEVISLLNRVGLPDPERRLNAYPHELSGGMQQRVMIAMALACRPRMLVADEPTTALDVTIQAQILDLLVRLQEELGMAILLITHNLGLVAGVARRVNVMYAGRIVERGPVEQILGQSAHPYTRGLMAAVPRLSGGKTRMIGIPGAVPNPARLPTGCPFHPRCPKAQALCRQEDPIETIITEDHRVRCHFWK